MLRALLASLLLLSSANVLAANELAAAPNQIRPILLGSKMPDVPLQTATGMATTLKAQVAGKPAILVFFRGNWCPFCNLQLSELRLIQKQVEALGYQLIAMSPERPEEITRTIGKDKLQYTLLSDANADAMRAFGIGYVLDAPTLARYKTMNADLDARSGHDHHALPVPSVFIVDGDGVLQFSYIHPDFRVRVPGSVILAAAQAIAKREHKLHPKE